MSETLYDKYGGFATVSKLVHVFYEKVLDSDDLAPFFKDVEMKKLMAHQTKFLAHVLGGPDEYTGRQLRAVHKGLEITKPLFDEVAELLAETLEEGGVSDDDVKTIIGIVAGTVDDIVTAA